MHLFARSYCSLAYSDLAAMRMGMSGSASFHRSSSRPMVCLAFSRSPLAA